MSEQKSMPGIDYTRSRSVPSNFCNLRHTNEEFMIDLGMSGIDQTADAMIDTSVVLSPFTAKRLLNSLGVIVSDYEQVFGEIEIKPENRAISPRPTPFGGAISPISKPLLKRTGFTRQFVGSAEPVDPESPPVPDPSPCLPAGFGDNDGDG